MKTKLTSIIITACMAFAGCVQAQSQARNVQQLSNDGTLTTHVATGAKTLKISATGTLEFVSGASITGASAMRTALGLGNVENTALSTWAGSANITTLGTVATGVWSGTAIALGKIAQGGATSNQVMAWNGSAWAPTTIASGITIGSTAITGGTSGRAMYDNAGVVGEFTGLSITGGALVDVTTSGRFYGAAEPGYPQFTESGYSGNGMRVYSDRLDFWVGGTPQLTVMAGQFQLGSTAINWGSNTYLYGASDGTGRLVQRNGAASMQFSVARTYTTFTNKEEVELGWTGTLAHLWTVKGSEAGTARDLALGVDESEKMRVTSSGVSIGGGAAIKTVLHATATLDFSELATADAAESLTITVTGAEPGDSVMPAWPASALTDAAATWYAWVSASDTVTIRVYIGHYGAGFDPPSATFGVTVVKH